MNMHLAASRLDGATAAAPAPRIQAELGLLPPALTLTTQGYDDMKVRFDPQTRTAWCQFAPKPSPSFTFALLRDMLRFKRSVTAMFTTAPEGEIPIRYVVGGSALPGIYNLGGDLAFFADCIRRQDRAALTTYAHDCCEMIHHVHSGFGLPLIMIGLVQGDALGGGFEAALACNVLVAERKARFGLPEVMFNLFPGMGAYSFLSRRVGAIKAEQMILSGRIYTAEELHEIGLVDVLADDGRGEQTVRDYIAENGKRFGVMRAIRDVRHRVNPVTLDELIDVTDRWLDEAMALEDAQLRRMELLMGAQARRLKAAAPKSDAVAG